MAEVLVNSLVNPTTILTASAASGDASFTVRAPTSPDVWSTAGTFRVLIDTELVTVTAASTTATTLTVVARGVEGTTAAAHASGANVDLVSTAVGIPTYVVGLLSPFYAVTSGSLSTVSLSSGVASQISTARGVTTHTPVTFNPGVATTATCTIAISPDNVTFSTLGVETLPVGVALDGTIRVLCVPLPQSWYIKLSVNAQAVLGTTTWY